MCTKKYCPQDNMQQMSPILHDSTTRFIHDQIKEHLNNENSSVKKTPPYLSRLRSPGNRH